MHLGMTGLRGISDDKELEPWLKDIVAAEHMLSDKEILSGAHFGVVECLRTGTTTVCDMYDPMDVSIAAAKALGIRLVNLPNFFTVHRTLDAQEIPTLVPSLRGLPSTITQGIAPHSIYGTDEKFLRAVTTYAAKESLLVHIHVAETRKERVMCKQKTGFLPVEYLNHIGFLHSNVMIAHAVWLTKHELDLLAKHEVKVVHCPQSNMKLAGGGVLALKEMMERKITVCLGTDSTASNNSLDMFRAMYVTALLHKHHYWDPTVANAQTVLDMATRNGARAIGREKDLGSIESGKIADIITLDLHDANLMPIDKKRVVSHLVYAAQGLNVAEVIVDGKLLLKEKMFVK